MFRVYVFSTFHSSFLRIWVCSSLEEIWGFEITPALCSETHGRAYFISVNKVLGDVVVRFVCVFVFTINKSLAKN